MSEKGSNMSFEFWQITNICPVYDKRWLPVPFYNITVLNHYTPTQHLVDETYMDETY